VAVWVQLDMARRRLARFAQWQAGWAKEGWRIVETEWKPGAGGVGAPGGTGSGAAAGAGRLEIPGQAAVALRGKIDRIDVRDGEIAILDYKTGNRCLPPEKTHGPMRDGSWRDLQLPLYRTLYPPAAQAARVRLGYVALPSETDETALQEAGWGADQLEDAMETAREVVRRIREMAFDDFGRIGGWRYDFATEAILAQRQITTLSPFARLAIAAPTEAAGVAEGGGGAPGGRGGAP
jgi:ATP-dependent helicase/nuclease subunit B